MVKVVLEEEFFFSNLRELRVLHELEMFPGHCRPTEEEAFHFH